MALPLPRARLSALARPIGGLQPTLCSYGRAPDYKSCQYDMNPS
jgi:hypothetical protein